MKHGHAPVHLCLRRCITRDREIHGAQLTAAMLMLLREHGQGGG
jgi:hypothetical protein